MWQADLRNAFTRKASAFCSRALCKRKIVEGSRFEEVRSSVELESEEAKREEFDSRVHAELTHTPAVGTHRLTWRIEPDRIA